MSFNFGNTSTLATSTPAKPFTNFGFAGASTSAFGAPATSAPAFGAVNSAPAFGSTSFGGFNAAPTTTSTGFGGSFGFGTSTVTTSTSAFGTGTGFGGFGTTTSTAAPAFGGFGTTPATGGAPTAFGGFGTTTSTAAPSAFSGFGTSTAAAPSFGGFGTGSTGFGGFGGATSTTAPMMNRFGTSTTTNQGFGGFGNSFNSAPAFGGFSSSFGQPSFGQQQPAQPPPLNPEEAFAQSIFNVSIFGDERDTTLARWNYLQAMWGTGKSYYSQTNPPIDITTDNYLSRFKAIGYNQLPGKDNKIGLVGLVVNKPLSQIKDQQQQLISSLNQVFGNKPNLVINVESMKSFSEAKCQVVIYVEEKSTPAPNTSIETKQRILATELCNFLNQPMTKNQLTNLGIEQIIALVLPDADQLKEYLETPPKGIDPRMWKQAKLDNPDPSKFIPVPMIGFQDLKWRIRCQETETEIHASYLANVDKEIAELKQRHSNTNAKIMAYRRKHAELSHRVLKIIVKQESTRKMGISLSPEEEKIRSKLENMHALISAPTQFKGRLSELLSQMRMQRNQWAHSISEYTLDQDSSEEMKSFLTMQHKAMTLLIETVNKDLKDLKIISEGMGALLQG